MRQLARKLGIDLSTLTGSGPEGRILIEDLASRLPGAGITPPARQASVADYGKPGTRLKMQGLRRTIAQRMALSKQTIPHYSFVDECDVTDLVRLREALRDRYAQAGVKLTYLPFFVKAVVAALKEVPIVNASLDEQAGEIVLHDRYHIGIAVATPAGLMVPVVHDADQKDIGALARDIEQLSGAARAGKSRREDLLGGTFTITSVGSHGGLIATPVINPPEVGDSGSGQDRHADPSTTPPDRFAPPTRFICRCPSIIASSMAPSPPPSPTPSCVNCKTPPLFCCRPVCKSSWTKSAIPSKLAALAAWQILLDHLFGMTLALIFL